MRGNFTVLRAGIATSVQDLGRKDHRNIGIPVAGVLDTQAFTIANELLGNPVNASVLEIQLKGPSLLCSCTTRVVITGAQIEVKRNARHLQMNKVYWLKEGDILDIGKVTSGVRSYLAIDGGFKTEEVLGSKSWSKGITKTNVLLRDQIVPFFFAKSNLGARVKKAIIINNLQNTTNEDVVAVSKHIEFDSCSDDVQNILLSERFTVSRLYNRMAIQAEEVIPNTLRSITSGVTIPGTVQLTPSGRLVILLNDCAVSGGYPRVLQVSKEGLALLSQKREGDTFSFSIV